MDVKKQRESLQIRPELITLLYFKLRTTFDMQYLKQKQLNNWDIQ
jgi:hypothetical protein